jgi:hypothetical protein
MRRKEHQFVTQHHTTSSTDVQYILAGLLQWRHHTLLTCHQWYFKTTLGMTSSMLPG